MRTFYNQSEHEKYIELSPKRNEKKSLPVISHKEIPLHNYSFEKKYKKYKKTIDDQLQMKRWAYVSNPKKRDPLIIKYAKYFEG